MKRGFGKGFFAGALAVTLVVGLSVTALAATRTIKVDDDIRVTLNGANFTPKDADGKEVPLFSYDGTTYAPVRAICEAAGLKVDYDSATYTAVLTTQDQYVASTPGASNYITAEQAKSAALKHAGVNASDAIFVKAGLDWDDGKVHYEVEFYAGNTEYDYDIDAVSGAVLFAKTSKALTRLNEMIREGRIRKIYWALTEQAPDPLSGELCHYILRDGRANRSRACDAPKADAKQARLRYATLGAGTHYTLVEVELLTGRHHQIRAQLSKIGCPIRGDLKYGARRSLPGGGISLHSRRVEFEHPVRREPVSVTAPAPADDNLWAYFENR